MNRHLWTKHRDYALRNRVPSEDETCRVCGKTMRRDNLRRHLAMHKPL